jgi:hypothetical protein
MIARGPSDVGVGEVLVAVVIVAFPDMGLALAGAFAGTTLRREGPARAGPSP